MKRLINQLKKGSWLEKFRLLTEVMTCCVAKDLVEFFIVSTWNWFWSERKLVDVDRKRASSLKVDKVFDVRTMNNARQVLFPRNDGFPSLHDGLLTS